MGKMVTQYKLLLSAPSDIKENEEIQIIKNIIEEFNRTIGDTQNIYLVAKYWRDDTYAQMGDTPQNIINSQIVDECDAIIAVMWTRFGTATESYGSGTEEEIMRLLNEGKQVFLYFSERPVNPGNINHDQWSKVCEFKEKNRKNGLYFAYRELDDFKKLVHRHLILHFMNKDDSQIAELNCRKSELSINSYFNEQICDELKLEQSNYGKSEFFHGKLTSIIEIANQINQITISRQVPEQPPAPYYKGFHNLLGESSLNKFINAGLAKSDELIITEFLSSHKISITDDFFELGGLLEQQMVFSLPFGGSPQRELKGTEEEKAKYQLLKRLRLEILTFIEFEHFFKAMDNFYFTTLLVSNIGNIADTNINITLFIPKNHFVGADDFPTPKPRVIEAITEWLLPLFTGENSHKVNSYPNYRIKAPSISSVIPMPKSGEEAYEDSKKKYYSDLNRLFCYEYYTNAESDILKFDLSYLKHNEHTFFPSLLFLKHPITSIRYEIRSEQCPSLIEGILESKANN